MNLSCTPNIVLLENHETPPTHVLWRDWFSTMNRFIVPSAVMHLDGELGWVLVCGWGNKEGDDTSIPSEM